MDAGAERVQDPDERGTVRRQAAGVHRKAATLALLLMLAALLV